MKIAIDGRMYGMENGGIGRYVLNLVNELHELDKENHYAILLRKKYFNQLNWQNKNWKKVLVDAHHYTLREQVLITRILKKLEPDLVHFPHLNVPYFYKEKYVVTIHDLLMNKRKGGESTTLSPMLFHLKKLAFNRVFKSALYNSERIIVPSNAVKAEMARKYSDVAGKINVVYEGVDASMYKQSSETSILSKFKIEKPYFLYVGNVYPHKNVERIIEATASLNTKTDSKITIAIVTPRNVFQKRLNDYVAKHVASEFVRFTGFIKDNELAYLYKHAVAFVYPSKEEGFGLPGLEAMANKCLVLASDIPVFKEIYKQNVIYFNPLDFSSIEKAMHGALEMTRDKKVEIVSKAYEFSKNYTWEKSAAETLKVYEEVLTD